MSRSIIQRLAAVLTATSDDRLKAIVATVVKDEVQSLSPNAVRSHLDALGNPSLPPQQFLYTSSIQFANIPNEEKRERVLAILKRPDLDDWGATAALQIYISSYVSSSTPIFSRDELPDIRKVLQQSGKIKPDQMAAADYLTSISTSRAT